MWKRRSFMFGSLCVAVLLTTTAMLRAEEPAATTISVEGMHCAACAKNIAGRLQAVNGVAKAQADAAQSIAVIVPKSNAALSPRALWEAVEKAGYKPVKLVGPSGTFTSKPRS